jgi:cytochrome c-type biogenesis protein CcmE
MRRPRLATMIGLALVVGAFIALATISLTSALVYYVTPSELASSPPSGAVRLYGIVEPGSVRWDAPSSTLSFRITDGTTTMVVTSRSLPTGLFGDGIGVVLAGRGNGPGAFEADEILVKHSEVYEPLKPGQTPPPGLLESLRGDSR